MKKIPAIFLSLLLCLSLLVIPEQALHCDEPNTDPVPITLRDPVEPDDTDDPAGLIALCCLPGYDHENHGH